MVATAPPQHSNLSEMPGVIRYWWRGGHATKPKALAHLTLKIIDGDYQPPIRPGCTVTFSVLTPYAKRIGVTAIESVWCPS